MKKIVFFAAFLVGGFVVLWGAVICGSYAGSVIGERLLGSKEPMIEMLVGAWVGLAIGIGLNVAGWVSLRFRAKVRKGPDDGVR